MQHSMPGALGRALQNAATAAVPERAFLRVSGSDATRWLNGMVTNSVQALGPGEGAYSFFLNAQGRIQGDCVLYREPGTMGEASYLIATTSPQADGLAAHLDRFIIMDDVELIPALAEEQTLSLIGPEIGTQLQALGLPALEPLRLARADTAHGQVLVSTPGLRFVPRTEIRGSGAALAALAHQLQGAGLPALDQLERHQLRVVLAEPEFGTDIRDRDLPQETAQTQALHFNKGCYVGQEIVERIRSRGQVHRQFTAFSLQGETPAELPVSLEANGKTVGELTSVARVPFAAGDVVLALGYARREALETHAPLHYHGGTAVPRVVSDFPR